jgi:hypothetical protein
MGDESNRSIVNAVVKDNVRRSGKQLPENAMNFKKIIRTNA